MQELQAQPQAHKYLENLSQFQAPQNVLGNNKNAEQKQEQQIKIQKKQEIKVAQTPGDYAVCVLLMIITCGLVALVYYISQECLRSNYEATLASFGGIFIAYLVVLGIAWSIGIRKVDQMQKDMIDANIKMEQNN